MFDKARVHYKNYMLRFKYSMRYRIQSRFSLTEYNEIRINAFLGSNAFYKHLVFGKEFSSREIDANTVKSIDISKQEESYFDTILPIRCCVNYYVLGGKNRLTIIQVPLEEYSGLKLKVLSKKALFHKVENIYSDERKLGKIVFSITR